MWWCADTFTHRINFLNVGSDQFNKIENDIVSLFTFKNVAKIFSIRNETKNGVREVTHITLPRHCYQESGVRWVNFILISCSHMKTKGY